MLSKHLSQQILSNFPHTPTPGQAVLVDSLAEFITDLAQKEVFILKGYAGTGKTTVIAALVKTLGGFGIFTKLLAPTGRAAKVIASFSGVQAFTIHKSIYIQRSSKDGFGKFVLNRNLMSSTIFIVDEASMIANQGDDASIFGSGQLLNDLLQFVHNDKRCKLLVIGDTAQLPPVGLAISPALDSVYFSQKGYNAREVHLTDVVRQTAESGILFNATQIRTIITSGIARYPQIETRQFKDISNISGADFISLLTDSYDKEGLQNNIVVCRSNKRANGFNEGIRKQILGLESELSAGDLIMVVKNNYYWTEVQKINDFIANGDIAEIVKIHKYYERYGYKYARVTIRMIDSDIPEMEVIVMLDTLTIEAPALPYDKHRELFYKISEDYADEKTTKIQHQKVREDEFFNALQIKFAYAVTCHKAQGGQWKNVFIDQGWFIDDMLNIEYLRWLYTAITRATENVYLVSFNKEFLAEK